MALIKPLKYISVNTALVIESSQKQLTGYAYGTYGAWTTTREPKAIKKTTKVSYSSKNKNTQGSPSKLSSELKSNVTINGTTIKAAQSRSVGGTIMSDVPCKYRYRSKIEYGKKTKSGGKYKQTKTVYSKYYYQIYYKDKPIYSDVKKTEVADDKTTAFFDSYYLDAIGKRIERTSWLPHPTTFNVNYEDLDVNLDVGQTYGGRNTLGTYVKQNIRSNIRTIDVTWEGISKEDAAQFVQVLSPSYTAYKRGLLKAGDQYVNIQFEDPLEGGIYTGIFFASDRKFEILPNGYYKTISVMFTEV